MSAVNQGAILTTVAASDAPIAVAVAMAPAQEAATAIPVAPAVEAGLTVIAEARWPESEHDQIPPALPGFIVSSFSPIAAETAARCLSRRPIDSGAAAPTAVRDTAAEPLVAAPTTVRDTAAEPLVTAIAEAVIRSAGIVPSSATAVIIASARGDLESASHVAQAVDASATLGPLLFFQSVPNAVAGHIAARWNLTGPVVCVADRASALEAAALLIEDGDADEALVLHVEQSAHAVLVRRTRPTQEAIRD